MEFPLGQLTNLATILRNGEVVAKLARFEKETWHCVGWGLRAKSGDPDAPAFAAALFEGAFGSAENMTDETCAAAIDAAIVSYKSSEANGLTAAVPWDIVAPVLMFLVQRLLEQLKKKKG